jgi:hypothetical protein
MNHTATPWQLTDKRVIERPIRISEHYAIGPKAGPTFAFLPKGSYLQEGNANLMVLAPELLETVKGLIRLIDMDGISEPDDAAGLSDEIVMIQSSNEYRNAKLILSQLEER